jgi:hypothetical protein
MGEMRSGFVRGDFRKAQRRDSVGEEPWSIGNALPAKRGIN